jgi:hypothetical protein
MAKAGLRLLARDDEDLNVFSAYLQDAVFRLGDAAYLPKTHRFALLVNRYCWEDECQDGSSMRVRTGVVFNGVLKTLVQHLNQEDRAAVHELLAIHFAPGEDGAGHVDLHLAGGGCIRLEVECIDAALSDLAEPWPAKARPRHDLETQ